MLNLDISFANKTILKHHLHLANPNRTMRREPLLYSMVLKPYKQIHKTEIITDVNELIKRGKTNANSWSIYISYQYFLWITTTLRRNTTNKSQQFLVRYFHG
jgi:hypothetical protein